MAHHLHLGHTPLRIHQHPVEGRLVTLEGESFYQIANYDRMRPFFMTVVSDADHWLFISSNGGLTAGRRDADLALFPYYTDDKIRDMAEVTGSKTLLRVRRRGPGLPLGAVLGARQRGLSGAPESLQELLGQQAHLRGDQRGPGADFPLRLVQQPALRLCPPRLAGELRAGVQRGSGCSTACRTSCPAASAASSSSNTAPCSTPTRRANCCPTPVSGCSAQLHPRRSPRAGRSAPHHVAWSLGLKRELTLLSSVQLDRFRQGKRLQQETDVRAERGAYFVQSELSCVPVKARIG